MRRQYTFKQYRIIDLVLFAVMLSVFEFLTVTAARFWFPMEAFTVSVVAPVTAIVMMRWGPFAGIHAVLGGLVFCLMSGASPLHFLIYCVGNLLALLTLLLRKYIGAEKIRTSPLLSLLFAFCTQVLMQLGRAVMALIVGFSFGVSLGFFTTDALSIIFTMVIIWIVRNLDGIFEDQKTYLLRLQKEREKERGVIS